MKLSFRGWLTLLTLGLLVLVVFAAWPEIAKAWGLMGRVDLWILALLVPVQLFSYYATGGMIFSYLRAKGNLEDMSHWSTTRLALELNFVNHILPSGGAAGFSYLAWVLKKHKVSVARSTMAQLVRFVLTFLSFIVLLVVTIVALLFEHQIGSVVILIGVALSVAAVVALWGGIWLIKSNARLRAFSGWLSSTANRIIAWVSRGRKKDVVRHDVVLEFFDGLHDDYLAIRRERKILVKPFIWAIIANILDVALIWIAFWSLGYPLNPALLFIAFGVASIVGALSVTPGGAGVYETIMVAFLAASGVTPGVAIAGTLLARVALLGGTILFGYVFYQLTVIRYGKRPADR